MRRLALTGLSAAFYALAFPPWDLQPFAWVALVPFLVALRGLSPLHAGVLGFLWGTVMVWAVGYWVPRALAVYYAQPWWFGVLFAFGASMAFAGTYYAGFGMCAAILEQRADGAVRAVLLSTLWVTWELARARLLT